VADVNCTWADSSSGPEYVACHGCNGKGWVSVVDSWNVPRAVKFKCPVCEGRGYVPYDPDRPGSVTTISITCQPGEPIRVQPFSDSQVAAELAQQITKSIGQYATKGQRAL
jgi:DnaJ-class molecular chaperone